jgi:hypothetical protein
MVHLTSFIIMKTDFYLFRKRKHLYRSVTWTGNWVLLPMHGFCWQTMHNVGMSRPKLAYPFAFICSLSGKFSSAGLNNVDVLVIFKRCEGL